MPLPVTEAAINRFAKALPKANRRIPLDALWEALKSALPESVHNQPRETLKALIDKLIERGYVLPKNRKLYDSNAAPALPTWLQQPASNADTETATKFNPKSHLWARELSFLAGDYSRLTSSYHRWLKIDAWLKTIGRETDSIPVRERSFEIFGDEKILDTFMHTQPFKQGLIDLETLRCAITPAPLAWEKGPSNCAAKPCLVIENSATWRTLALWNRASGMYSAVIYGDGNKFSQSWHGLELVLETVAFNSIRYFGDVDYDGLMIPFRVHKDIETTLHIDFTLDVTLYQLLYNAVTKSKWSTASTKKNRLPQALNIWLPKAITPWFEEVIRSGKRVPQEGLQRRHLLANN